MRSQNAAETLSGRIARLRDRFRFAFVLSALCGTAALAACDGGPAPAIGSLPSSGVNTTPQIAILPTQPAPAAPASLAADLMGLRAAAVAALLGSPDFRRSEPPAELWQYRNADCILDVFLYEDSLGYYVVRAETRERRRLVTTGSGCSASFARHGRPSGL